MTPSTRPTAGSWLLSLSFLCTAVAVMMVAGRVESKLACGERHSCLAFGEYAAYDQENEMEPLVTELLEVEASLPRDIKGRIKLNKTIYRAVCRCLDSNGTCTAPTRIRVHQEAFNQKRGLTKRGILALLGGPQTFQLLDSTRISFGCTDGRDPNVVLSTLGGGTGEFIQALSVFEELVDRNLTQVETKEMLSRYLSELDFPMSYCTDQSAVLHLAKHLQVGGAIGVIGLDIENPKDEYKAPLQQDIIKANNQGCLFTKALLTDSPRYFVRRELVENVLQSLFAILWDKAKLGSDGVPLYKKIDVKIFEGFHSEKAWINFRANSRCEIAKRAPGFAPLYQGISVFVYHPVAVGSLRSQLASFFSRQQELDGVPDSELFFRFTRRGFANLDSAAHTFANVPFYTVRVE